MTKSKLKKYAELIVQVGANVQSGQDVLIYAGVEQKQLVTYVVSECYKRKARRVEVNWECDEISKIKYKKESIKTLSEVSEITHAKQRYMCDKLPVMIYIESSDPDALKGVNQGKIAKIRQNQYPVLKPYRDQRENKYQWVIVGASSKAWAKKVFPNLPTNKAVEALWDAIMKTSRCDEDPIKAWEKHNANLAKRTNYLNSLKLDYLHYTNKKGTDFKVWLLPNVKWEAGGERTLGSNIYYNPNIPTEECFTSPAKGKAKGIVYSTKPSLIICLNVLRLIGVLMRFI